MNRFDDKWHWRLLEKVLVPAFSVLVAYIAFRVQLEHRITVVETVTDTLKADVKDIKSDVKEILLRLPIPPHGR